VRVRPPPPAMRNLLKPLKAGLEKNPENTFPKLAPEEKIQDLTCIC